ncbi:MAG TPA: adenylate/guanylate cyclase domain-containing protein, partial [Aggregatilineales bacterium]|nr:adenylate/guanylate cyclase domain-containing protein [Aggregatilineales bacterium]
MQELDPTLLPRLSKFLTSDLLDELPDSSAMSQSVKRLNSLSRALSSYLPGYITRNETLLTENHSRLTPGTFMFADVSGFTALSETLMRRAGSDGIEILTQIFNDYFTTMLEILAKSEGYLLKFAGDALLTFFPTGEAEDEFPKAIHTALRMQRAMHARFQPIQHETLKYWFGDNHELELSMSIGICSGRLFEAFVGGIAQRDHMIMGSLPGKAMAAEEAGERDDVIINAELQATCTDRFDTMPTASGFFRIVDNFGDKLGDYEFSMPQRRQSKSPFLFSFDDSSLLSDLEKELVRIEQVSRFVSPEILNKLVVQGDHIESENRIATVIFVHFTGFSELLEAWGDKRLELITVILSQYYGIMQRVVTTHGGVLTRSDPYKLGCKLLITFGAPIAHPDDTDRAVAMALEMNRQLEIFNNRLREEFPEDIHRYPFIKQRMGITQGHAYAGEVGWRQRREYTVMGDDVNLAARLMAYAGFGQIVISQSVYDRVNLSFKTRALPPFQAKGKSALVQSYTVVEALKARGTRTSSTPFIGREVTLLSLNIALEKTKSTAGLPYITALHGDIGAGKTRLAMQLSEAARNSDFAVAWTTCHQQNTRKTTWTAVVAQLLEIDPHGEFDVQQQIMAEKLEILGIPESRETLLGLVFNTASPVPKTKSKKDIQKQSRVRANLFARLSSEATRQIDKDLIASFRKHVGKILEEKTSEFPFWDDLQMKHGLADSLIQFLRVYTQKKPTLIVIDDLHKENLRALNILKRIMNETTDSHLMILVTHEPEQINLNIQKIAVSDLPEEQTSLMVMALLNTTEPGPRLSEFIWKSTSGRVLYIESLTHALIEQNQLEEIQGVIDLKPETNVDALPTSIRGLIISRIDRLSSDARAILRAAAALEDRFSVGALSHISEINNIDYTLQILTDLSDLQILAYEEKDTYFKFRHGVTQQAIYEQLTRAQRQKLHENAAEYFAKQDDSITQILNIADHLMKAGQISRAVTAITKAAKQAEQNADIERVLELYSRT